MHVDIDGATRIARTAAEFDWTWYVEDIERFCSTLGWEVASRGEYGAEIHTNLPISHPAADVYWQKRTVNYISTRISDMPVESNEQRRALLAGFAELPEALIEVLGAPTGMLTDEQAVIRWDLPKVVLFIRLSDHAVSLKLVSPEYQAWKDEPKFDEE
ncbi:DUF6301 family protein [Nocardia sp. NPDC004151]|uniref:DUF6301 family protein n=1 Tax=Nocardia sp. NPDC004151 TaxID=3364304 RepID=UPI0036744255